MKWLVAIAHPDDEVLACGGTIARLTAAGQTVRVVLSLQRRDPRGIEHWGSLLDALSASCAILGAELHVLDTLIGEDVATSRLTELHELLLPEIEWSDSVVTHFPGDVHAAHRAVAAAVEVGTRPFRRRRNVYFGEVATSTDQAFGPPFVPTAYVELGDDEVDRTLKAIECYPTEDAPGRNPTDLRRALELRGAQIGCSYAEAFHVARQFHLR